MGYCGEREVNRGHPDTPYREVLQGEEVPLLEVINGVMEPDSPKN